MSGRGLKPGCGHSWEGAGLAQWRASAAFPRSQDEAVGFSGPVATVDLLSGTRKTHSQKRGFHEGTGVLGPKSW